MAKQGHHWAKKKKIEKHKREQYDFLKTTFYAFLFIFFVVVFCVLIFSSVLKITNISISGLSSLESEEIQKSIKDYTNFKSTFVFPRDNLLVFSERGIENHLKENFKKIRSVSVSKNFPGSVEINIKEKDLLLLWCSKGECFMIDENGRAYKKADLESRILQENDLIQIFDLSEKDVFEGGYVLKREYCDAALELKDEIYEKTGIVVSPKFETTSRIAEEIVVKTSEGWKIYFDSSTPIDESMRIFNAFFGKEIDEEKRANLEYIDLRATNKIFYKLVGEDGQDSEQESEDSEQEAVGSDQEAVISEQEAVGSDQGEDEINEEAQSE